MSSKWLEFDIVIIPWYYNELKNNKLNDNVYFVAFTRASEKLIITHHNWNSEIELKIKKMDTSLCDEYKIKENNINNNSDISNEIDISDLPF